MQQLSGLYYWSCLVNDASLEIGGGFIPVSTQGRPRGARPRYDPVLSQVDIGRHSVSELCFEVLAHLQQLRQSNHNLYIIIIHVPQNLFCESRRLQRVVCCFLRSEKEGSLTGWRRSAQHWNAIIQHHRKTVRAVCDLHKKRKKKWATDDSSLWLSFAEKLRNCAREW